MTLNEKLNLFHERYYDNISKMELLNHLIADYIEKDRETHEENFCHLNEELDELLDCIYFEQVEEVLKNIKRKDEMKGIKWTVEDVKPIKEKFFKEFEEDELLVWYLMNRNYAVHYDNSMPIEFYIGLSLDELRHCKDDVTHEIKYKFEKIEKETKLNETK